MKLQDLGLNEDGYLELNDGTKIKVNCQEYEIRYNEDGDGFLEMWYQVAKNGKRVFYSHSVSKKMDYITGTIITKDLELKLCYYEDFKTGKKVEKPELVELSIL